ncbi:MAG: hypothetical protein HRU46_15750 [Verrucomicrobiales bacterium]|nr:hypothetical protein [Verrucomicrobiales bacterium]
MKVRRVIAWALIGLAALPVLASFAVFLSGGFYAKRAMGSFFFASFFLGMTGWMIGDF